MIVIGLTGSIGMGKTTVAGQFAHVGVPVSSADAIVHQLMRRGGAAVLPIKRLFPSVIENGAVNRKRLGDIVFADRTKLRRLERLLHPLVVAEERRFTTRARRMGVRMVLMEIPLLYETRAERRCDVVVVATAPHALQRRRVLARANMTDEKFAAILRLQMSDAQKRRRADKIVFTGLGKGTSFRQVLEWVRQLREWDEARNRR